MDLMSVIEAIINLLKKFLEGMVEQKTRAATVMVLLTIIIFIVILDNMFGLRESFSENRRIATISAAQDVINKTQNNDVKAKMESIQRNAMRKNTNIAYFGLSWLNTNEISLSKQYSKPTRQVAVTKLTIVIYIISFIIIFVFFSFTIYKHEHWINGIQIITVVISSVIFSYIAVAIYISFLLFLYVLNIAGIFPALILSVVSTFVFSYLFPRLQYFFLDVLGDSNIYNSLYF
jgi:uncharacterized BrkB/YihY/UPF0761 family membrane protein